MVKELLFQHVFLNLNFIRLFLAEQGGHIFQHLTNPKVNQSEFNCPRLTHGLSENYPDSICRCC